MKLLSLLAFTTLFVSSHLLALEGDSKGANKSETNNQDSSEEHATEIKPLPQYIFSHSEHVAQQVTDLLATAKNNHKKAIIVLGAQWCHDSRSLAKKFSTPEMQTILTAHFETLFVDAGYFEKGFELVKQFGLPVYFGTPTVLVIDPVTQTLLNKPQLTKWLNADALPLSDYTTDFTKFAQMQLSTNKHQNHNQQTAQLTVQSSPKLAALNQQIDVFYQQQSARLNDAYKVIGPMLKAYMKSDAKKASDEFSDAWESVHAVRYNLYQDVMKLRADAANIVKHDSEAPLKMPQYAQFSWEKSTLH